MILVISTFITHKRPVNKYNRLDVFKHTLKSYSKIKWSRVYLFIKLDWRFKLRAGEIRRYINDIFLDVQVVIAMTRYEKQHEWSDFIKKIAIEDDFIWFTQNDDHPFIDINMDVLNEGLELMRSDKSKYKSLYLSHWTEILKLSGKCCEPEKIGSYVRFEGTLIDSIQIFNSEYLKYIFLELDWMGKKYKRIDTILRQKKLWGDKNGNIEESLQVIYIPLREICRKFSGYGHVNMSGVQPLEFDYKVKKLSRTSIDITNTMNAAHKSMWTEDNKFTVPQQWIDCSIELYKNE